MGTFWQENFPFIKGFFDDRSTKFLELMDKAESSIAEINADKIYTSKEFKKIRDNFTNIAKNLERNEVREWLAQTKDLLTSEQKSGGTKDAEDAKLKGLLDRFTNLLPQVNETKLVTDMLWKSYEYTDEMAPIVEFTNEILGNVTREVNTNSVTETDGLIEKHNKTMDKFEKKKKSIRDLITKGEKLSAEGKAPEFLVEKVGSMKKLFSDTTDSAKDRMTDLKTNAGNWETYTQECIDLRGKIEVAQNQINDVKKLYDMEAAKNDYSNRMSSASEIKADITKTLNKVCAAKDVLHGLADDGMKEQLKTEVDELKTGCEVMAALDAKLKWLDEFNSKIVDFNKIVTELEELIVKDRKQLDDLIKPPEPMKSTDRLVAAMDLGEDVIGQLEIHKTKQDLWESELFPEGKENTPQAQEFVKRMGAIVEKLTALSEETQKEEVKYGDDIVYICEVTNGKQQFLAWITGSEEKAAKGYPSPNSLEEATVMLNDAKAWKDSCEQMLQVLETTKGSIKKLSLPQEYEKELAGMMCRWDVVQKASVEWIAKMEELSGHWTKETEILGKVTEAMNAKPGEMTADDLDKHIETVKQMYAKKQDMMKKMSNTTAPSPAALEVP